jgi:DNA-binding CsgD family transcriptional regulator
MAADAMRAARRADSRPALIPALQAAATVAAYRGDAAAATELAQELIAFGPARELLLGARHGHVVLGFLALSAGDAGTACEHYVRASASLDVVVPLQPAVPPLRWFVVDALLDAGDLDAATRVTEHLESLTDNALAAAVAATARGRLASIRGDRGAADAAFAQALLAHDRLGWPFERAVTQYHYGCALHDQRRRALARSVLGAARDAFDAWGASAWTTRAQTALAAISGRAPAGPQALTRAEDEVAALAASGLTNQQIAQRLFVSPKTVATHLSHTYAKLNVRSRTELAARMRRTGPHDHNGQSTTLADE